MKNSTTAKNLKSLRQQHHIGLALLSRFLDVDRSLLSDFEKGKIPLSPETLEKWATLVGYSGEEIASDPLPLKKNTCPFPSKGLALDDLVYIFAVNKVALNLEEMRRGRRTSDSERIHAK